MEKRENPIERVTTSPEAKRVLPSGTPGKPELNYFREARLFLGKGRATLTFYRENEVASIHFDKERREIFYKGHNVNNMTLSEDKWESLQKFADFLPKEAKVEELKKAYLECLGQVMRRRVQRGQ